MKSKDSPTTKEHYQQLRLLTGEQLWSQEVPRFDRASPQERMEQVSVIRAVGVAFSQAEATAQKEQVRQWLLSLLQDPAEKIRRYAMVALPKIGAGEKEESELLTLLGKSASDRETKFLAKTLGKIGGEATLDAKVTGLDQTMQKVEANLARLRTPSAIRFETFLLGSDGLQIHLRCRSGLEQILADELQEAIKAGAKFRKITQARGIVTIAPVGPFKLADLYSFRCFSTASLVLGTVEGEGDAVDVEPLAAAIASPSAQRIFEAFTEGPIRYRLDFVSKGHQRSVVRRLADRVYALCPKLLNDSRNATWELNIHHTAHGCSVELSPKLRPDPRFYYRTGDVPAASHPPLAACMARLAGNANQERIWDPFCGSGLELIERTLRGGVTQIFGTDRSEEAVAITRSNFAAATHASSLNTTFAVCDFRDHATIAGLGALSISLIITNPPMGRRVPIPNLRGLIEDLFAAAAETLQPGGRLVFVNPLPIDPQALPLKLQFRQKVDLGGFYCWLEKYLKL